MAEALPATIPTAKAMPLLAVPAAIIWGLLTGWSNRKPAKDRQGTHHRIGGKLRAVARQTRVPRSLLDGRGWAATDCGSPWWVRWDEDDEKSGAYLLPARLRNSRTDEARRARIAMTEASAAEPLTPHDAVPIHGTGWQTAGGWEFAAWAYVHLTADEAEYVETGIEKALKVAHGTEDAEPDKRITLPTRMLDSLPDVLAALAWWRDPSKPMPDFRLQPDGSGYGEDGQRPPQTEIAVEDDVAAAAAIFRETGASPPCA